LGEEDIVGLVFGFEAVATDGANRLSGDGRASKVRSREPKAADTYWGSLGHDHHRRCNI
jgi:hypothetical protein